MRWKAPPVKWCAKVVVLLCLLSGICAVVRADSARVNQGGAFTDFRSNFICAAQCRSAVMPATASPLGPEMFKQFRPDVLPHGINGVYINMKAPALSTFASIPQTSGKWSSFTSPVPEPATWLLVGAGELLVVVIVRKKLLSRF